MDQFYHSKNSSKIFLGIKLSLILIIFTLLPSLIIAQTVTTISTSGTFTVPAGVTSITAYLWGGGGGAGGSSSGAWFANGGGGGGGACASATFTVSAGQVYTSTIGAGGTGGPASTATAGSGGTTTFTGPAGTWTAGGGAGGVGSTGGGGTHAGGAGSTVGTGPGVTVRSGGNGCAGNDGTSTTTGRIGIGGGGGGSTGNGTSPASTCAAVGTGGTGTYPGGLGGKTTGCGTTTNGAGVAGAVFGAGGGGANCWTATFTGGAGGAGRVVLVYTIPCTAPTTQATIGAYTANTTGNSLTVNWTRGSGNNVLVVARLTATGNITPGDGTTYTANANFGSGSTTGAGNFVVYSGTGTSANITGLTSGTSYTFSVYEFNLTGPCYLSPASSSAVTTFALPTLNVPGSGSNSINCGTNTILYDNGGTGNYAINTDGFTVINNGYTGVITLSGTYSGIETCCDYIQIYAGAGIGGTLLATYGPLGSGTITTVVSAPGQALTVRFYSDVSVVGAGFVFNVAYSGACIPPAPTISSFIPTTVCQGDSIVVTGANFASITGVTLGGTAAASYIVRSTSSITAFAGVGTSGSIAISNTGGTGSLPGLTVNAKPVITTQPIAPAAFCGGASTATATVVATGASSYLWYKGGVPMADGATYTGTATSTITITNPSVLENGASLTCVVTGVGSCSVTTLPIVLTITTPPANPTSYTASPGNICLSQSSIINAVSTGNNINWYTVPTGGTAFTQVASGTNVTVTPTSTTTYYAESYTGASATLTFNYTGAITTWTVPAGVTSITATARGAQGGSNGGTGGLGASVQGTLTVTPGQVLSILVGQQPPNTGSFAGGGGGSYIANGSAFATATPLIVAGGGGGATSGTGGAGQITNITTSGNGGGPVPGINGNGAASTSCGGGGGGFYTSGGNDNLTAPTFIANGGAGFRQGGAGGTASGYSSGGFGGGAPANYYGACNMQGGAGGGYSGGSGQNSGIGLNTGFGGGSYNTGTSQVNTAGVNSGNGVITISYVSIGCPSIIRMPVTVNVGNYPIISVQPTPPAPFCGGGTATLTVTASGATTYQWYKGVTPISDDAVYSGSATNSLTITNPSTLDNGASITCVITGTGGCNVTSNAIILSISSPAPAPPTASGTPTNICTGQSALINGVSAGNSINWYTIPTGGSAFSQVASGVNVTVSPTSSQTYYAETYTGAAGTVTFNYTGALQTFVVPGGVTSISVDASGAQGFGSSTPGALGGRVQAVLPVTPGQTLNIYVGGAGTACNAGGYNGGANATCTYTQSGTGGGATDIRIGGTALSNRVIVAGGGGGAGYNCGIGDFGGAGGGLTGGTGMQCYTTTPGGGNGGTPSAGGAGGVYAGWTSGTNGALGNGGAGATGTGGGGGGGGYYGGGGGSWGGGGGGSSYTDPSASSVVHTQGVRAGNGQLSISYFSVGCSSLTRTPVTINVGAYPTIITQPTAITPVCGSGVTSTTINASGASSIQWYKGGVPMTDDSVYTGTNTNTLTITNPSLLESGSLFTCVLTGTFGCTVTSNSVTLVVGNTPSNPTGVSASSPSICVGQSTNLVATSAGNSINWYTIPTGGSAFSQVASGVNVTVSPTSSQTYYAETYTGAAGTVTFNYTGALQTFVVPGGVTSISVDASGAQGFGSSTPGALGGRVQAVLPVTPGQTLNIYVGGAGTACNAGGYNGGANATCTYTQSGTGGGATDIRIGGTALSNRVIVAGGGGGAGYNCGIGDFGGAGGGLTGGTGMQCYTTTPGGGNGGTPSAGGAGGVYAGWTSGTNGALGNGGAGATGTGGGGGGGGYYGGGGGSWGGGGGGSSYTDPSASSVVHTQGVRAGNGQLSISYFSSGCPSASRVPVTVTVNPLPTVAISPSVSNYCTPGGPGVVLTASGASGYLWSTGSTTNPITVTPTSVTSYTVTGTSTLGCTASATQSITVSTAPSATAFLSPDTICEGLPVTLSSTGTGAPISGNYTVTSIPFAPVSGTPIAGPAGDDLLSGAIPIGFTFPYYGANYTNVYISTNGFITFDAAAGSGCCSGLPLPLPGAPDNLIATCWTDLNTGSGGTIDYFNLTSPNRFVVRYNGVAHYAGTTQVTSQIIIYQSGIIEIHNTNINSQGTMSQGIENIGGTLGTPVSGRNATGFTATNDAFRFSPPTLAITGYSWSGPNAFTSGIQNTTVPSAGPIGGSYTVTVTDANGCTASASTLALTVRLNSTTPTIATATPSSIICAGDSTALSIDGTAGTGALVKWYTGSCGGTLIGIGNGFKVSPTTTTTYYGRLEGICNTTTCASITVTVNAVSIAATSTTSTPDHGCEGSTITLNASGYTAGIGATPTWWTGPGGTGTYIGTGSSVVTTIISPTYYMRLEGTCNSVESVVNVSMGGSSNVILASGPSTNPIAYCEDGSWTYYEHPSMPGKFVFAIRWGTANTTAKATAQVFIQNNATSISNETTRGSGLKDAAYVMQRYWNVDLGGSTLVSPVDIKFYYDPAEIAAMTAARDSELTLLNTITPGRYFPVSFSWFKTVGIPFTPSLINDGNNFAFSNIRLTPSISGTESGINYVEFDGITSFSGGTGGIGISPNAGVGLPVTLTNIEAVPVDNKFIQVRWTTATEINNKGFDVMRSEDGVNFTKVGYVSGNNNSTTTINYSYNDYEVVSDIVYYYRLLQIDNDGATTPTRIVNATITGENGVLVGDFYPNPTRNITSIDINNMKFDNISVKVYDMMGKLVLNQDSKLIKGVNKISLNMNMFADGNYHATIQLDNQEKIFKKIIIQK
ncbi:MAG: glycine-rich protein [Betaproteobacteria bacterium]